MADCDCDDPDAYDFMLSSPAIRLAWLFTSGFLDLDFIYHANP